MRTVLPLADIFDCSGKAAIQLLPFLLMAFPKVGSKRGPLIVLDQYEGSGIKLICRSEESESLDIQLSWMDGKGNEFPATPVTLENGGIASSVLLQPGSRDAISCSIISKSTNTSMGTTSLFVAGIFFPSTSILMVVFFIMAIFSIVLVLATYFKLKKDRWKIALTENEYKSIEEETRLLQKTLDEEKNQYQKDLKDFQENFEKATAELEFRRASSNAVSIILDSKVKHTKLNLKDKNRVKLDQPNAGQKNLQGALIVVAQEGYSYGKYYWEVEVGEKPDWELGVLTAKAREKLEKEKLEKPLEDGYVGMRRFQDKYYPSGGDSIIDCQNEKCEVVGVFLDMEQNALSFFDVQRMCPIRIIPVEFKAKMYPYFNPGYDDSYLGVRQVSSPACLGPL